jgi:hypothetical protein
VVFCIMFFSLRRRDDDDDEDSIIGAKDKGKMSLSSVVKLNETKSPSPKKTAPSGTGLLSIVTTISTTDPTGKEAGISSDELVKKLFKGLGIPAFKAEVQTPYLKTEVPSAIKDYRWGAFDLPVYHDTTLSIVRPPTPPAAPEPVQLLLDCVPFSEERNQAASQPSEEKQSNKLPGGGAPGAPQSGRASTFSQPQNGLAVASNDGHNDDALENITGRKSTRQKLSRDGSAGERKATAHISTPNIAEATDTGSGRGSSGSRPVVARASFTGMSTVTEADREEASPAPATQSARSQKEMQAFVDTEMQALWQQMDELNLPGDDKPASATTDKRNRSKSDNAALGENILGGEEASVDALLQLDSLESQRQYLKPGAAPQPETVLDAKSGTRGEEKSLPVEGQSPTIGASEESLPPAPAQEQLQSPLRSSSSGHTHSSVTSPPAPHKAEGKVISPASRSVFRPTFAAPRPSEGQLSTDHEGLHGNPAALLQVGDHSPKHFSSNSEEQGHNSFEGVLSSSSSHSPSKAKKSAFAVLEEAFLHDHQQHQGYGYNLNSPEQSPWLMHQPQEQYVATQEYAQNRQSHSQNAQHGFEKHADDHLHGVSGEKGSPEEHHHPRHRRHKKHASPGKHWYMAGAYSSHSEAADAINKMARVVEAHGAPAEEEIDGAEGPPSEGKFRLQRDLARMQWVVECSDEANKQLVLSHGNRVGGSHEKERDKYRRIVQSVQGSGQPAPQSPRQGRAKAGAAASLHEKDWDLSPPVQRPLGGKLQVQQRREDKYLRERDTHYENNLRMIRQQLPKDDPRRDQRHQDGDVRFPPIRMSGQEGGAPQPQKGNKKRKKR